MAISRGLTNQACLGLCKRSGSPELTTRFLRFYLEPLTGFSHVCYSDDLHNILLFQGYVLRTASIIGTMGRMDIPRTREGVWNLQNFLEPSCGPTVGHIVQMIFSIKRKGGLELVHDGSENLALSLDFPVIWAIIKPLYLYLP